MSSIKHNQKMRQIYSETGRVRGHYSFNDMKKVIELYREKKNLFAISVETGRTPNSIRNIINLYNQAIKCENFGCEWSNEEWMLIKSDNFNKDEFYKTYKRSSYELSKYSGINRQIPKTHELIKKIVDPLRIKKTYSDVPKKNFVQQQLYRQLMDKELPLLTLLGPTPERYINMLIGYNILGDNFLYSNEIDIEAFNKVIKNISKIKFNKLNLSFGNILSSSAQPIIDLDLMGRWDTQNTLIKTLFNKQKVLNGEKHFMFTLSIRGINNTKLPEYLSNMLSELFNSDIKVTNKRTINFKKNGIIHYVDKFFAPNKNYKINIWRYVDTSPMISILISYNEICDTILIPIRKPKLKKLDRDVIYDLYFNQHMSQLEIREKFNASKGAISDIIKKLKKIA
jgi:hypothetical protein